LGKTTLLQVLAGLEAKEDGKTKIQTFKESDFLSKLHRTKYDSFTIHPLFAYEQKTIEFAFQIFNFVEVTDDTLADMRVINKIMKETKVFGYGANRFMSSNSLTDSKLENSATLFDDDAKLINAEEWLLQLDYSASKPSPVQEFAQKKRDQVKEILIELLP